MSIVFVVVVLVTLVLIKRLIIAVAVIKVQNQRNESCPIYTIFPSYLSNLTSETDATMHSALDSSVFKEKSNRTFVLRLDCGTGSYKGDGSNSKSPHIPYNSIHFPECILNLLGSRVSLPR